MTRQGRPMAVAIAMFAVLAITATGSAAMAVGDGADGADSRGRAISVNLSGFNEDPGVVSTTGSGTLRARINAAGDEITYQLSYRALVGTPTQAHFHLGGRAQSGGVFVFLCSNLGNAPAGTQACPPAPATITGTLKATDMVAGATAQGLAPGEFAEAVTAIRAGKVYVNVHSTTFPGGEIRGQLSGR